MRELRTLVVVAALLLAACGEDHERHHHGIVIQTLSDQHADGDIAFSPSPEPDGTYTITQADATGSVLFGIDSEGAEYRAFLDFPLDGSTGGEVVPLDAAIVSAEINVCVNSVDLASTVPTLLDLVPFPLTGLEPLDFDSTPLATLGFDFFRSDEGDCVWMEVTPLMEEVQRQGLPDLQLRFLLDFVSGAAGLVELYDGANENEAPLLSVEIR